MHAYDYDKLLMFVLIVLFYFSGTAVLNSLQQKSGTSQSNNSKLYVVKLLVNIANYIWLES